jgi:hypothetical protein
MTYKYTVTDYLCNPWHNFGSDEEPTGTITLTWWSNSAKDAVAKKGPVSQTMEGNTGACSVMQLEVLEKNGKVIMERWS